MSAEGAGRLPQCAECGAVWFRADDNRSKVFLTDDESPELAFYCPPCAQREFGES